MRWFRTLCRIIYSCFILCNSCELPKAKAFGLLASTSLLFSKFKRIFKKSYILSTSVNSLCTTGTILKKFYDRKVFSICQLPTFKKFQRTNLIISTLKLKGFFVKKLLNLLKNKFALYPKPEGMGFTACYYKYYKLKTAFLSAPTYDLARLVRIIKRRSCFTIFTSEAN